MNPETRSRLETGLKQLGLNAYRQQIADYLSLLGRWNRAFNLVARAPEPVWVDRHILDSLSLRPYIKGKHCLDVGSGAGLPGLLLAVTMPDKAWVLLDANGKKTRFCQQVVREMRLRNVEVIQQRVEHYQPARAFDSIICRAYSRADSFVKQVSHLLGDNGIMLAMKGKIEGDEMRAANMTAFCLQIEKLDMLKALGPRHVMIFKRQ